MTSLPPAPSAARIRAEAQSWVARLADAGVSAADHSAFDAWLNASPVHDQAYRRALRHYSAAGELAARFADEVRPQAPKRFGAWARSGLGLALAASLALAIALPLRERPVRPDYATTIAQIREVRLDDGTRVTLGADTALEVTFSDQERRVRIGDGEAYFDVSHDAARPFFVETGAATIRVLGTAFDVKSMRGLVRVSVARGVVQVAERGQLIHLVAARPAHTVPAGHEVLIAESAAAAPVAVTALARAPASWREGYLIYDGASLAEVVADANRYSNRSIRIANEDLARLRVTASYPTDEVDVMLSSLDVGLPIDVDRSNEDEIVIVAQQAR